MLPDAGLPDDAALFTLEETGDGTVVTATEYARGPWDERACHGGPVSAVLVRAVEALGADGPSPWQIARTTIELVRPVPVGTPLRVRTEVERPGRNVSLVAVALRTVDGDVEVARSRTLRIRAAMVPTVGAAARERPFSEAGAGVRATSSWAASDLTAFHKDSVELRFVSGSFTDPGPCRLWCRLRVPIVPGEDPTGVQRTIAAADFANGVSGELDTSAVTFLNPDLTVHLAHQPDGEWVGLDARSHYGTLGAGMSDTALYDREGRTGRSVQSLFVAART